MIIESMEQAGQFVNEMSDAVRCPFTSRILDFFRERSHLLDQFQFIVIGQGIPFDVGPVTVEIGTGFFRLPIDAVNPGMGILDIVNRVLVAVRFSKIQIEIELRI